MTKRTCSVEGCGRPFRSKGWCNMHYQRWIKYGDPVFIQVASKGEGLAWLQAAAFRETDECIDWPFACGNSSGRGHIWWEGRTRFAHHVVLILAGRNVPAWPLEVRHLCGNRLCVNVRHLLDGTRSENYADSVGHGTCSRGERNGKAKLTEADVRAIRAAVGTSSEIATRYGTSHPNVHSIRTRRSWAWLD